MWITKSYINSTINTNEPKKAIEEFKETLRINPDYADTYCVLGKIYSLQGLYDKAIKEYKKAISINPDFVEAHSDIEAAYAVSGKQKEALDEYNILKNLDKEKANKLFNLIYK